MGLSLAQSEARPPAAAAPIKNWAGRGGKIELSLAQPEARPQAAPILRRNFGQKAGSRCDAGGWCGRGVPPPPMIYTGREGGRGSKSPRPFAGISIPAGYFATLPGVFSKIVAFRRGTYPKGRGDRAAGMNTDPGFFRFFGTAIFRFWILHSAQIAVAIQELAARHLPRRRRSGGRSLLLHRRSGLLVLPTAKNEGNHSPNRRDPEHSEDNNRPQSPTARASLAGTFMGTKSKSGLRISGASLRIFSES